MRDEGVESEITGEAAKNYPGDTFSSKVYTLDQYLSHILLQSEFQIEPSLFQKTMELLPDFGVSLVQG